MKNIFILLVFGFTVLKAQQPQTPYEEGNGNQTTTYEEMTAFYDALDREFETISVQKFWTGR